MAQLGDMQEHISIATNPDNRPGCEAPLQESLWSVSGKVV